MSEPTCQWCGAGVKTRFCEPDTGFTQMILFHCDAEYYPQEGDEAWSRRPTLKCGQRCAEQMRRLRVFRAEGVNHDTIDKYIEFRAQAVLGDAITAAVRAAVDSVTEGG